MSEIVNTWPLLQPNTSRPRTGPCFTIYEGNYSRNYGSTSLLFEDPRTEIRTQSIFITYRKEENISIH